VHDTTDDADIEPTTGTLSWAAGDTAPRSIPLRPTDDAATEGEERFRVRLSGPTGGAGLGAPEIEVTIEDDEALQALQFAEPVVVITEGQVAEVTITRPASTPGPVIARYAMAPDLDAAGRPTPRADSTLYTVRIVGELSWDADDISSRTLRVYTVGSGGTQPDDTIYVTLADTSGTLRANGDWKAAHVAVVNDAELDNPPPPPPPPPPDTPAGNGGGGAISPELLSLLLICWLVEVARGIRRKR
jgi:hypothetical protein